MTLHLILAGYTLRHIRAKRYGKTPSWHYIDAINRVSNDYATAVSAKWPYRFIGR
jgi:hypothetical protein